MMPCASAQPRLATVMCQRCKATNFENFRFCQLCGWQRPTLMLPAAISVDWETTNQLASVLETAAATTRHAQSKDAVLENFSAFCASLDQPCHAALATPRTVILWLAHRASSSLTAGKEHTVACTQQEDCDCPVRMKFSSLIKLLGKLHTVLKEQCGLGSVFVPQAMLGAGGGNPTDATSVKLWVKAYETHQKGLGMAVEQVPPIVQADVVMIIAEIDRRLVAPLALCAMKDADEDYRLRYVFDHLLMRSFLAADSSTGQRGSDLSQTLCRKVAWFPDKDGLLMSWTAGKTFRDTHTFGMPFSSDKDDTTCGCAAVVQWARFCTDTLGWNMSVGYLWPAISNTGLLRDARLDEPFPIRKIGDSFKALVTASAVTRPLTLSGLRSGVAIRRALSGETLQSCMEKSYWKTSRTALHYIKLFEVLGHSGLKRKPDSMHVSEAEYREINELPLNAYCAFGPDGSFNE